MRVTDKWLYKNLFSVCNVTVHRNGYDYHYTAMPIHYDDESVWFESKDGTVECEDRSAITFLCMLRSERFGKYDPGSD